jgi:hypothetical protein
MESSRAVWPLAKIFPFSSPATADFFIDEAYGGGAKGNAADDILGKLIPGAGANRAKSVVEAASPAGSASERYHGDTHAIRR